MKPVRPRESEQPSRPASRRERERADASPISWLDRPVALGGGNGTRVLGVCSDAPDAPALLAFWQTASAERGEAA